MCEFIDGDFFESLFEFNFDSNERAEILEKKPEFVFASTGSLLKVIDFINICNPSFSFNLITHNADSTIYMEDSGLIYYEYGLSGFAPPPPIEIRLPKQIKKLYSQNLNVKNDDFFVSLPIGLERERWSGGYKHSAMRSLVEKRGSVDKKHLVYCNYLAQNNPSKRGFDLKNVNCFYRERCHFDIYANDIMNSFFVMCPVGNGLDTHRAWESLYLGSYPIVENNYFNQAVFSDLPAILVDDFSQITNDFLELKKEEMRDKEKNKEKLTQKYYIDLIFGTKHDKTKKFQHIGS